VSKPNQIKMQQNPVIVGVMGWPVSHSLSPVIHTHWIQKHSLNGSYRLFPVHPDNLEAAIRGLSALQLSGSNVTIPHKVAAMKYMDWIHPDALKIGAINTIVVNPDGALHGFNTDGFGFLENLRSNAPNWDKSRGPATVIGAGGAARSILIALLEKGIQEIRLTNRTTEKAQELASEFGPQIQVVKWQDRHDALSGASLLVNTTNQGMKGQPALDLRLDKLPSSAVVSDIVYNPLHTTLLKEAHNRGNLCVDGLGMLIHQARPAFNAWFGVLPEASEDLRRKLLGLI
jgi:shikimate dehydrogenase